MLPYRSETVLRHSVIHTWSLAGSPQAHPEHSPTCAKYKLLWKHTRWHWHKTVITYHTTNEKGIKHDKCWVQKPPQTPVKEGGKKGWCSIHLPVTSAIGGLFYPTQIKLYQVKMNFSEHYDSYTWILRYFRILIRDRWGAAGYLHTASQLSKVSEFGHHSWTVNMQHLISSVGNWLPHLSLITGSLSQLIMGLYASIYTV